MNNPNTLDWESMLAQQAETNPKMKMLYQMMQQNQENKPRPSNSKTTGQLQKLVRINKSLVKKNKSLKLKMKQLLKYLNFFIDVNTVFSSAVGACECWGEDNRCQQCNGKGHPGFYDVDENAFQQYVLPCMDRISEESTPERAEKPKFEYIPNN